MAKQAVIKSEKTVDVSDLPEEIRKIIYNRYDGDISNGCYKRWYVHDEQKPRSEHKGGKILYVDKSCDYIIEKGDDPVSEYLVKSGCKRGETILLKISW